jgi:hypothetical protein
VIKAIRGTKKERRPNFGNLQAKNKYLSPLKIYVEP